MTKKKQSRTNRKQVAYTARDEHPKSGDRLMPTTCATCELNLRFCLLSRNCASSFCIFWFIIWSPEKKRNPLKFFWGHNMNSLMDGAHRGCRCQSKVKNSRPRHLHQSTLHLGDTAPCYSTTHHQVTVNDWFRVRSQCAVSSSFCLFLFVRLILEGQPADVLSSSIWEIPASPHSITPGWISVTTPAHLWRLHCCHTAKMCTGPKASPR